MNITGMNLFDRNAGKACRQVRPRCRLYMDITDIDLFDQHVGMECAKIRF